jgi:PAS domain S-box-containing protein
MKNTTDLLKSFSQCKAICRNFPYPVIAVNSEGVILDGCDDISHVLGQPTSKLKNKKLLELPVFTGSGVIALKKLIKEAFEKNASPRSEVTVKINNIETAMEVTANMVTEEEGKLLFLIFYDVTCIRSTQKELEDSRLRYRTLFENMRSGVAVYQAINNGDDFIITEFNKVAEQSDRVKRKDVIGKNIKEVFPGVDKIGFLEVLRRVWETGTPEVFPPTIYEDQRVGKVWWEDYLYKLPSGEIVAAFANITEHMQSLEDLQKSMDEVVSERNKIQAIVQSIGDGIFVVDPSGAIKLFNKEMSRMTGVSEEEAIGKSYKDLLTFRFEGSQREVNGFIDEVIKTGVAIKGDHELILISRDDEQVPVSHSASPIRGEKGIDGIAVVLRDMTGEREVDRLKTEFVSIASHQMYTPLMGTKWFLELLLRGKVGTVPPDQQKYLEQVNASNDRIISIVEDLLFASKVGAGDRYSAVKEPSDLIVLIDESIKQNVDLIEKNKITVLKEEDFPEHLIASVDIQMMKRIFYNLISNACKYSKPLGTVEIGCDQSKESETIFSIKDNGYGIPQRQQSRIFERFFRADNVVTKVNEGTGLGLYIIRSLAEAHGGKVWFESIENVGTTFYLSIPNESADKKRKRAGSSRSSAFDASSDTKTV